MSHEPPIAGNEVAPRRQISIPLAQIKRNPAVNLIGLPELIGLLGAALLAIMVIFAYLYFYLPANARRVAIESDRTRLQTQVQMVGKQVQEDNTTSHSVAQISASLEDFESNWLPVQNSGRLSLYAVLNELIKSNGLKNTAGPNYAPLEVLGTKTQVQPGITAEKQSNAKWQSIYPGIAVSVTVEGLYPNIRRFVRDVETSKQFLIINAIELEGVRQSGASTVESSLPTIKTTSPKSGKNSKSASAGTAPQDTEIAGGRGGLVSLRLDLATYFQRPDAQQPPPQN